MVITKLRRQIMRDCERMLNAAGTDPGAISHADLSAVYLDKTGA